MPLQHELLPQDLQNGTAGRLIGFSTSGVPSEITLGTNLSMTGSTLNATGGGGGGSVTSVAMTVPTILSVAGSPITSSGTLALTLTNQAANIIFAGPASGASTTPTFRSIVNADLPNLITEDVPGTTYTIVAADNKKVKQFSNASGCTITIPSGLGIGFESFLYRKVGAGTLTMITSGTTLEATATTIEYEKTGASIFNKGSEVYVALGNLGAGVGTGTVTSVGLSGITSLITVGNSPIVTSGTMTMSLATQNANQGFFGPTSGAATAPAFRSMVIQDLPNEVIEDVSSTTYTYVEADNKKIKRFTNASGCATTIPIGLSTGWATLAYRGSAAGSVSFTSNGTYEGAGTTLSTAATAATILHRGSDAHVVLGAFTLGGGGITNSAANTELMKSDGTNAVPSGLFIPSNGNLTLGSSSISGSRTINAASSDGTSDIILTAKGSSGKYQFTINTSIATTLDVKPIGTRDVNIENSDTSGYLRLNRSAAVVGSTITVGDYAASSNKFITLGLHSSTTTVQVTGGAGVSGSTTGNTVLLNGGAAYNVGNNNGGGIILRSGAKNGSGLDGDITIDTLTRYLIISTIPTSSAGLPSGAVWSNSNVLTRVP